MSELIDRQDVIDRLKKAEDVFRQNGAKLEANGIHYALELVESDIEIPTVTKDYDTGYQDGLEDGLNDIRPQGKWIKQEWGYICSVCNESNDYAYDNNTHKFTDNFCPNCGADMREEAEE